MPFSSDSTRFHLRPFLLRTKYDDGAKGIQEPQGQRDNLLLTYPFTHIRSWVECGDDTRVYNNREDTLDTFACNIIHMLRYLG
jgi:hypothetical protein